MDNDLYKSKNYSLLKLLGNGGYGDVYLAKDKANNRLVAVKMIEILNSQNGLNEAINEVNILYQLHHPRIIKLLDFYITSKMNIVMEYANNGTFMQILNRHRANRVHISIQEILIYFSDILMGVNYLHMRGVLHRDLKPENLLITARNRIVLADFGIANLNVHGNETNIIKVGTPLYMAPEIINENYYSNKSDVWSMGIIFYEMCTLKLPFSSNNLNDLIKKIMNIEKKPIEFYRCNNIHNNSINNILQNICDMMIIYDYKERYSLNQIISHPFLTAAFFNNFLSYD